MIGNDKVQVINSFCTAIITQSEFKWCSPYIGVKYLAILFQFANVVHTNLKPTAHTCYETRLATKSREKSKSR